MSEAADKVADDDTYNSASDEDFDPNAPPASGRDAEVSSSDEEATDQSGKRTHSVEVLDFDNSGDEATMSRVKRKRQKTGKQALDLDDEGGEGGLVKTRAQRKAEVQEKKPLAQATGSTLDVDAVWAQMSANTQKSGPAASTAKLHAESGQPANDHQPAPSSNLESQTTEKSTATDGPSKIVASEETIVIKRTYEFAGRRMEEERTVPASSAEARLFLEEQARQNQEQSKPSNPTLRRPVKRKSMFAGANTGTTTAPGPKLNTLEKSKLDWAAHVDQEGISEELNEAHRAKGGYLGRMDFLDRMSAKREDELQVKKPE